MIGKIIGAGIGAKAAQHTSKIGGPWGAAIGAAAPMVLRRLSIPAMIALAAGGYAVKKLTEKKDEPQNATSKKKTAPQVEPPKTSTAPATA